MKLQTRNVCANMESSLFFPSVNLRMPHALLCNLYYISNIAVSVLKTQRQASDSFKKTIYLNEENSSALSKAQWHCVSELHK